MRIKKDKDTKNEYIQVGDVWIRNFTKKNVKPQGINNFYRPEDYKIILDNEVQNLSHNYMNIINENFNFSKVIIASDGFDFNNKQYLLEGLPKDVAILAVNGVLSKWNLLKAKNPRAINFYVVNNPYIECLNFLPKKNKYYPTCVASIRTYPSFLEGYLGKIYRYVPIHERNFGVIRKELDYIDDYRNPICSAINLAYRFGVEKLLLFCCDDSFKEKRSGAISINKGFWTYPQHLKSREIIDGNLYWLKNNSEVEVKNHSEVEYNCAEYITIDEINKFFSNEEEKVTDGP